MKWEKVSLSGWGRIGRAEHMACAPEDTAEACAALGMADERGIIPFGQGRSYGDAALNPRGFALLTARLNRVVDFDPATGNIVCEPGVTFHDLFREFLPRGYIVPVTPGTGFASIGGAVANDVHGKNHEHAGGFCNHVQRLDLLLPSGEIVRTSPLVRPELFAATVGGIGLTGVIVAVAFALQRVETNAVLLREEQIENLDDFFAAFERVRGTATYSVGWIDALTTGRALGRGVLETAELATESVPMPQPRRWRVPVDFPDFALNAWTVRAFNQLYYRRVPARGRERLLALDRFFYPLDAIRDWNRIYGKRGFYQFQCVVPDDQAFAGIRRLLEEVARSRAGSFLAVLKTLGDEGKGYLSFPMRGYTLALDFAARPGVRELLGRLERITLDHGGRIYLAKDACLSAEGFRAMYPKLERFRAVLAEVDPQARMNSDLARRLGIRAHGGRTVRQDAAAGLETGVLLRA